jgi:hypothetical protein
MAGYLDTQLLTAGLLADFGVGDVPPQYCATVLLDIRYKAGHRSIATRTWLRWNSSRKFRVVLFGHQTAHGGFWRSAAGHIDGVDAQL